MMWNRRQYDGVIYRGTTTTNVFVLADALQDATLSACYVTYYQHGEKVLEKSIDDVTIKTVTVNRPDGTSVEKKAVLVNLSQAETLLFDVINQATGQDDIRAQMRVRTANDESLATRYINLAIREVLKDGEI